MMKLSEKDKKAAFAVLVVAAAAIAAYALLLMPKSDLPSDGSEFYGMLQNSDRVGIFYDVRGAGPEQATAIYQCGVDIIGKGRFAQKKLEVVSCNEMECVTIKETLGFEQAMKKLDGMPYILIKPGNGSYSFFQRHMEIYIPDGGFGNTSCDISARES